MTGEPKSPSPTRRSLPVRVRRAISCHSLLLLLCSLFCQSKGQQIGTAPKTTTGGQPKLRRTQGTDRYALIGCALLDKAGNLWFGTTGEGVYRYDGKSFAQFTAKNGLS